VTAGSPTTEKSSTHPTSPRAPRVLGNLTYLVGLVDLLGGLSHGWRVRTHWLAEVLPGALSDAAAAATVVSGVFLIVLGHSLKRRKVRAWRAAVALLAMSAALHIVKTEPISAVLSLLGLALLVRYRSSFRALGDPATRWRSVGALAGLLLFSLLAGGFVVFMARDDVVGGFPSTTDLLTELVYGFVGVSGPLQFTSDRAGDVVFSILLGLGLMTLLTPVYLALRAPEPRPAMSDVDEHRLRELVARHPDSLGYFNLRRDKDVVWSPSGKAAIAYRVVSGVMLASGDPMGDPEAWPGAIKAFLERAEEHAWTPVVLACSERAGRAWVRDTGFSALELGDEAVVDTTAFTLEGRPMRNVRQMVRRVERAGYVVEVSRASEVDEGDRRRVLMDAEAWRGSATERGFSMALGRLLEQEDGDCVFVAARQDGVVRAFLQFVPWGPDGMSLDVMRRDRDADPGVNELMIASVLQAARELGVKQVSLNFAAFRSALEHRDRLGAGPVARLWGGVLHFASRWLQIESLYRFNAKFQPQWRSRFLIYPTGRDLPRAALAALEAEAFLAWPKLGRLGSTR
jgi:lysyl-tRNA synthetase class 2